MRWSSTHKVHCWLCLDRQHTNMHFWRWDFQHTKYIAGYVFIVDTQMCISGDEISNTQSTLLALRCSARHHTKHTMRKLIFISLVCLPANTRTCTANTRKCTARFRQTHVKVLQTHVHVLQDSDKQRLSWNAAQASKTSQCRKWTE